MATCFLSYNFTTLQLQQTKPSRLSQNYAFSPLGHVSVLSKSNDKCLFAGSGSLKSFVPYKRPTIGQILKREFAVHASPQDAEGFLSFLHVDTHWYAWAAALVVLPFAIKMLMNLTNEVEAVAEAVEDVAEEIGKVANNIGKAAVEFVENLSDEELEHLVEKVDDIAEAKSKEAQKVDILTEKVEEMRHKMDDFIVEKTKRGKKNCTTDKNHTK